jgi:hypothetical protein
MQVPFSNTWTSYIAKFSTLWLGWDSIMVYVHRHCVDIREGNNEEDREGKVSTENDLGPWDVWVDEGEPAPTSAPCEMDGWWMDKCMDDENNSFLGCFHVSYPSMLVNFVLKIYMHQPT